MTTTGIKAASASLTYDTLSRRKSVTFGDNSTQTYDYEADDDLSSIAHTFVTAPTTHNVTLTYSNDKLGRQVSETTSNSLYLYDPPLAATGPYGAATSLNQYPTVGSTTYSYTPNDPALLPSGSVTSDGVRAFFYDEKGNLTKARQGLESAGNFDEDRFDALGVRWYSYRSAPAANDTSRIELTDGLRPEVVFELHSTVAEGGTTPVVAGAYYSVLGPNPDERLIWINGTEASLKARYPHTNRRGDTIAIGRDGIAETKFKYGPFGESADSTAGYPWRFTGQRLNGWTGLYHFKARAYAPGIGRFLQPDPIGYGDGPNIYGYVQNDPINLVDPTGTQIFVPREDDKLVIILYTAYQHNRHIIPRHQPGTGRAPDRFALKLTPDQGRRLSALVVTAAERQGGVRKEGLATVYEAKVGNLFSKVGEDGQVSARLVTQSMGSIMDPGMLAEAQKMLADKPTAAAIAGASAQGKSVDIQIVITLYPVASVP